MYVNRVSAKLASLRGSVSSLAFAKTVFSKIVFTTLVVFLILNVIGFAFVSSTLSGSIVVGSYGRVSSSAMTLHTEGRWIKDSSNNTVLLRGVWLAEYADSCVGAWGGDYFNWNEVNVRSDMKNLRDVWQVNEFSTFIWGDWWLQNKAVTLPGFPTSHNYRFALTETARIAQQYGLYFQIRLYGVNSTAGRIEGLPFDSATGWTSTDFANFWANVARVMKDYPNVIFTLYDEPTGNKTSWFNGAKLAIDAIRSTGANNLIVVHYNYCGDCMWMADWVDQGYPTQNIVFSNHIYRFHGTFAYDPEAPTDISYIRAFLAKKPSATYYDGAAYKYITDTYNIPIWVSAIGSYGGATDNAEFAYFANSLQVLNELKLGYTAYQWFRAEIPWYVGTHSPNRVGQALINAIRNSSS